ncbi:MogA/MoaB family molybdenum cofactor biosynthesis protein [Proteocatella sphenisci]|uniref:MogA/MoaB family molybdenum cofactor biosynthesis protein n=1 Tax=Proteocatella sphenisci TaxID=181070 RepID=UPI00048CDB67|nr:MogA/MoaB family molybdenum cofactor biosynthesis protein [Proteocatella sphenisci]
MVIRYGIIVISDKGSEGERKDGCKEVIEQSLKGEVFAPSYYTIVPDETEDIQKAIKHCSDTLGIELVLTSGGTGFSKRDITPEATLPLLEKLTPGISEAIRYMSLQITPKAMLSRAVSGIRKETLIINLPGSPKAVEESVDYIKEPIIHGIEIMKGTASECARK